MLAVFLFCSQSFDFSCGLPENHSCGNADVHRMFGSELWEFDANIGCVDYGLLDAVHLVTHYDGVLTLFREGEVLEGSAILGLFDAYDGIPLGLKVVNSSEGILVVLPRYGILGSEGCFVHFGARRGRRDTAKDDAFDVHGVGSTEYGAYIIEATYVVQNDGQVFVLGHFIFGNRYTSQFLDTQFAVFSHAVNNLWVQRYIKKESTSRADSFYALGQGIT